MPKKEIKKCYLCEILKVVRCSQCRCYCCDKHAIDVEDENEKRDKIWCIGCFYTPDYERRRFNTKKMFKSASKAYKPLSVPGRT